MYYVIKKEEFPININVANLDAGIYTCKISVDGDVVVRKLAITK